MRDDLAICVPGGQEIQQFGTGFPADFSSIKQLISSTAPSGVLSDIQHRVQAQSWYASFSCEGLDLAQVKPAVVPTGDLGEAMPCCYLPQESPTCHQNQFVFTISSDVLISVLKWPALGACEQPLI